MMAYITVRVPVTVEVLLTGTVDATGLFRTDSWEAKIGTARPSSREVAAELRARFENPQDSIEAEVEGAITLDETEPGEPAVRDVTSLKFDNYTFEREAAR